MSTVRKKRNFKGLGLDVAAAPPAPEPEPIPMPTRLAPAAGGKKRPPPMTLKAPKAPPAGLSVDTNAPAAGEVPPPDSAPALGPNHKRMTYHTALSHTLANLDLGEERKFELKNNEELKDLQELGQGNGGSVKKVEHMPTGTIMAKKVR
jgi:mitogen-activated protein kinase kinase